MLSSKANRKILISLLLVTGFSVLSACGFRPLYSSTTNSGHVRNSLASVVVEEPKGRLHQQVRNHLIYLLSGGKDTGASRYQLKYVVTELKANALVQNTQSTIQVNRIIYQITTEFNLYDLNDQNKKTPVYTGSDLVKISYTRTRSEFNNIRTNKSASERASKKAAENLHLRLAAWFARK